MRNTLGLKTSAIFTALASLFTLSSFSSEALSQGSPKEKMQVVGFDDCYSVTTWPTVQGHPIQTTLPANNSSAEGGVEIDGALRNGRLVTPLSGIFSFVYTSIAPQPATMSVDMLVDVDLYYVDRQGNYQFLEFTPTFYTQTGTIFNSVNSWPHLLGFGNVLDYADIELEKANTQQSYAQQVTGYFTEIAPYNGNKGLGLNPPIVYNYCI